MATNVKNNDTLYSMLLESGTNELEIMEFTVGKQSYGINVAKVREIIKFTPIVPLPHSTTTQPGIIKVRNEIIPVIDLAEHLHLEFDENRDQERDLFIVTYFNQATMAFRVHAVQYISRFSWDNIENLSGKGSHSSEGVVVGIAKAADRMIQILDYEKILADLYPSASVTQEIVDSIQNVEDAHKSRPILVAEDSEFLRSFVLQALERAGYRNTVAKTNGQEAWDELQRAKAEGGSILDRFSVVISDIEMPKMDGQRLLRLIKEDPALKELPVIMFSSLISESMNEKCRELGASEMVSKPELLKLMDLLKKYISENKQ